MCTVVRPSSRHCPSYSYPAAPGTPTNRADRVGLLGILEKGLVRYCTETKHERDPGDPQFGVLGPNLDDAAPHGAELEDGGSFVGQPVLLLSYECPKLGTKVSDRNNDVRIDVV